MIQGEQEDLPNPVPLAPPVYYSIFTNEIPAAEQVHIRCPPSPGMLMVFGAKLFGKDVRILIDSGASGNFIDLNFCRSRGYRTVRMERPREIKIANSSSLRCEEMVSKAVFRYEGFKDVQDLQVLDTKGMFQVIFGQPFLRKYNPNIDWVERTITINRQHRQPEGLQTRTLHALGSETIDSELLNSLVTSSYDT